MAGYVILDIEVIDPAGYEEYKKLSPSSVAAYGGKFLVRGGKCETVEGQWNPQRVVVLEFDSVTIAKAWLESPEYQPARQLRQKYASSNAIIIEGA
jgi:uncharacterized protein (DUF1330 family)